MTFAPPSIIPPAPPGVDILANMRIARNRSGPVSGPTDYLWFYHQVKNKGPWDFKQRGKQYEAFGNFHYGAVGTAMGMAREVLERAAGWAQGRAGTSESKNGMWAGLAPYGDDPMDQMYIKAGVDYAKRIYGLY